MAKKPTTTTSRSRKPAGSSPLPVESVVAAHPVYAVPEAGEVESGMDYAEHESTYARFTSLVKWGIAASAVLVLFLFIVIHPMVPPPAS
ncbi:MAG: aa3-type cytochrome c oxidase subunit IV [Devosia sp.]|jgi:hypothetical protein|nr:aa3-type cytochrome c oxidase subunit IV [Devosiaceae bacterium]